ncbi:4Fe-4S binding protein [Sphaerochaeta sp. PS]|uniref:4Fe-4S binding protein n=1 Tax=Sphaerochaeta sp. PS TaxID=3076336 RepID=UPI0028A44743|nr:4Fe-4S binding protein [Sphaerochaeta sp. PS]MDT4762044.1 4Fe-4S binding protein [Sphaerochaeta sp. PS]
MQYFATTPKTEQTGERHLTVKAQRCPQNHRCPSVAICPFGALTQTGYAAPVIDYTKCTGCGKCTRYCMPRALVMERS